MSVVYSQIYNTREKLFERIPGSRKMNSHTFHQIRSVMKKELFVLPSLTAVLFIAAAFLVSFTGPGGGDPPSGDSRSINPRVRYGTGNPYLPLWEHLPDGEPRVFEDPDHPGKY